MRVAETAKLLAFLTELDNRTVTRATVAAWHEVIGHLGYEDCKRALVELNRESAEWIRPGHIAQRVMRMNALPNPATVLGPDYWTPPDPPEGLSDREYHAWTRDVWAEHKRVRSVQAQRVLDGGQG